MLEFIDPEDTEAIELLASLEEQLHVSWLKLKAGLEFASEREEEVAYAGYSAGYAKGLSDAFGLAIDEEEEDNSNGEG